MSTSSKIEESAPTTKIISKSGNISDRLRYNIDPLSFNNNIITIDEDGNI